METFAATLVLLLLLYIAFLWTRYPKDYPPHPTFSLPLVGDALEMGFSRKDAFQRFRSKFGDIFGFMLGSQRMVVVCDFDLIQEVGARDELSGRKFSTLTSKARGSLAPEDQSRNPGVITSSGKLWQEQRRFSLHTLRDLGFGKHGAEELILEEVNELINILALDKGQPIDIRNNFNISVLNALWMITTGERIKPNSPRQKELIQLFDQFVQSVDSPVISLILMNKSLSWVADRFMADPTEHVFAKLRLFMEETIQEVKKSYQDDNLRNFVDHFLKMSALQESSLEQVSFIGEEGHANLINNLIDFFVAGSETTSTTLNWAMLYMILNEDVQAKVHQELDEVIGKGIQPRFEDRSKTPYIEAVLHEVQRIGNIADRSVPHCATSDCYLSSGHFIPEGTMIFPWLGAVLHDPKHFPEPSKFDPTRYLDKDSKFKPHPKVIPFGLGKRRCLGETLARMELYLFFTGIMTRFRMEKAHLGDQPTTVPKSGAVMSPQPYKLKFIARD